MSVLEFHDVALGYESSSGALAADVTLRVSAGWTGVVGPNGAGKSTLLRVASGLLEPREGRIIAPDRRAYCDQRDDAPPPGFDAFVHAPDSRARLLQARFDIDSDWYGRWSSLSHGERRRIQIAVALHRDPDLLALDEPTNHIDAVTRDCLLRELRSFRRVGLIVSHDRAFLDALCTSCIFFEDDQLVLRNGTYSAGAAVAASEDATAVRSRDQARRERKKITDVAADRRREADRADARRSGRKSGRRDNDARAKRHAARVSGKDAMAGRSLNQISGRVRQAGDAVDRRFVRDRQELGLTMRGALARKSVLLRVPAGALELGSDRRLEFPELVVQRDDRIGISGLNGAGKSTLVRRVVKGLEIPDDRIVSIPQELGPEEARQIQRELAELPSTRRGNVLAAVACLGSDPERMLESERLSPGELRKLLLALGLSREPHCIVMDEPTNHLDLPSIECLEHALASCACALILVSHDDRFLTNLTTVRWTIEDGCVSTG